MKKAISTIAAIGFISTMLVNTAYAGHGHGRGHVQYFNPLWIPVAILSTVAATVATIVQPQAAYVQRGYYQPRQTVIYAEPRYYRQDHYYYRSPANNYSGEPGRAYEPPRYRDYR